MPKARNRKARINRKGITASPPRFVTNAAARKKSTAENINDLIRNIVRFRRAVAKEKERFPERGGGRDIRR